MSAEVLAINLQVYTKAFRLRILLRNMSFTSSVKTHVFLFKLVIKFLIFADLAIDSSICEKQEVDYEALTVVKLFTCLS